MPCLYGGLLLSDAQKATERDGGGESSNGERPELRAFDERSARPSSQCMHRFDSKRPAEVRP